MAAGWTGRPRHPNFCPWPSRNFRRSTFLENSLNPVRPIPWPAFSAMVTAIPVQKIKAATRSAQSWPQNSSPIRNMLATISAHRDQSSTLLDSIRVTSGASAQAGSIKRLKKDAAQRSIWTRPIRPRLMLCQSTCSKATQKMLRTSVLRSLGPRYTTKPVAPGHLHRPCVYGVCLRFHRALGRLSKLCNFRRCHAFDDKEGHVLFFPIIRHIFRVFVFVILVIGIKEPDATFTFAINLFPDIFRITPFRGWRIITRSYRSDVASTRVRPRSVREIRIRLNPWSTSCSTTWSCTDWLATGCPTASAAAKRVPCSSRLAMVPQT